MTFRVRHTTTYSYRGRASLCHSEARLKPRSFPGQTVTRSQIVVDPAPALTSERVDHFGNTTTYFAIQEPHETLDVTAESTVHVDRSAPPCTISWEAARDDVASSGDPDAIAAVEFTLPSPHVPKVPSVEAFARESFRPGRDLTEAVNDLNTRIHAAFEYVPGYTDVSTALEEVVADRKGVCQDFAHLAIGCVRSMGLPARYVSGYIETIPPKGRERVQGADASHAWFAAYVPGAGWIDFDPTNDLRVSNQHITVAWGRDFSDATPLKGVISGGGQQQVRVSVDVVRLDAESISDH